MRRRSASAAAAGGAFCLFLSSHSNEHIMYNKKRYNPSHSFSAPGGFRSLADSAQFARFGGFFSRFGYSAAADSHSNSIGDKEKDTTRSTTKGEEAPPPQKKEKAYSNPYLSQPTAESDERIRRAIEAAMGAAHGHHHDGGTHYHYPSSSSSSSSFSSSSSSSSSSSGSGAGSVAGSVSASSSEQGGNSSDNGNIERKPYANIKPHVWRVALTGGPCGGKSTALHHLQQRLTALGFRVFVVPEAATMVITGGGMYKDYGSFTSNQSLAFEGAVMQTKMALEDVFTQIAEASGEPSIIICDRGTMDTKAYLPQQSFEVLMDEFGWNATTLRDRRYDAVLHLVTAAIGAEQYYTTENNAARTETPQQAADLDYKILNAWIGHPHLLIIDNSTDFTEKMRRTIAHVCKVVGAPKPAHFTRKFIVDASRSAIPEGVSVERVTLEQTYLVKGKGEGTTGFIFIRRRGQNGSYTYSHSVRRAVEGESDDVCVVERQISGREYVALLKQADPKRQTVVKDVHCFVHNNQYFELQKYIEPDTGLTVLQCESEDPSELIDAPSWLKIVGEVSRDTAFSSYMISKTRTVPLTITPS